MAMLALAVNGDKNAQRWVNPAQPDKGRALAVELLHRKVNSYALFRRAYPGYGHFLPWFTVNQTRQRLVWSSAGSRQRRAGLVGRRCLGRIECPRYTLISIDCDSQDDREGSISHTHSIQSNPSI